MKIIKVLKKTFFKAIKYIKKGKSYKLGSLYQDSKEDLWEELADFLEDWREEFGGKKRVKKYRQVILYGSVVKIRPAYLFAERLENFIKLLISLSIIASAIAASVFGFVSMSGLVDILIGSIFGRTMLIVIGFCYLITASWKLLHIKDKPKI